MIYYYYYYYFMNFDIIIYCLISLFLFYIFGSTDSSSKALVLTYSNLFFPHKLYLLLSFLFHHLISQLSIIIWISLYLSLFIYFFFLLFFLFCQLPPLIQYHYISHMNWSKKICLWNPKFVDFINHLIHVYLSKYTRN